MREHLWCPECGGESTVRHTEFHVNQVERVRTCDNCPTQWTVVFGDPTVRGVAIYE